MALTNTAVKGAKPKSKQYRLTDGMGMYLLVKHSGKKYWRLDYTLHGKRKTYAIGTFPTVSLKEAREEREAAKKLVANGIDPVVERQLNREAQSEAAENTFYAVAMDWFSKNKSSWTTGHSRTISGRLEKNLFPWLGSRPIHEITVPELLRVLRRIEARGAIETAHRCRTIAGQVFRYAIASGLVDRDPAADLKGALTPVNPRKLPAVTNPREVGALMRAIRGYQGDVITRIALRLSALTFCRPGEIRHAEWREVNWIKKVWTIPGEKMKGKRDHIVPLAQQALDALREIHSVTGSGTYIFPSLRSNSRPMSENTVLAALRAMGYRKDQMVAHGFRSMASTILHDNGWEHDLIEMQLAHTVGSKVSQAYNRADRLKERVEMVQWYADFLGRLENAEDEQGDSAVSVRG